MIPRTVLLALALAGAATPASAGADPKTYLDEFARLARTDWPKNRSLMVVCHGHSVPSGYFKTPEVRSMEAYPHLLRQGLSEQYPHAVINVLVTAIGGEDSVAGAERFERDVLSHRPDVVLIDYSLNDRRKGLPAAKAAWEKMIVQAKARGVKVILLTPTPDLAAKPDDPSDPLNQHAEQVRALAAQHSVGLVDSLAVFRAAVAAGAKLEDLMSQPNHPNAQGHALVAGVIRKWFP